MRRTNYFLLAPVGRWVWVASERYGLPLPRLAGSHPIRADIGRRARKVEPNGEKGLQQVAHGKGEQQRLAPMSQPFTERAVLPKHPDSFLELEDLGNVIPQYIPTFLPAGQYINDTHRQLSEVKVEYGMIQLKDRRWLGQTIPGWLWRADALKLYELAYFAERDVLEIGAYNGLSTYILALALRDRPTSRKIFSVDLSADYLAITSDHLRRGKLLQYVKTVCARASMAMGQLTRDGHFFDFVFVNHSNTFSAIADVCKALSGFLAPGGFALFHNYNDARNRQGDPDFEVYQAVNALLDGNPSYTLHGVYGGGALVRRASK